MFGVQVGSDTFHASGTAAAPTANAAIATLAAPGAGVYQIEVDLGLSSTAETAVQNAELRHGATVVGKVGFTTSSTPQKTLYQRVTVLAGEAITVNATAGAIAGSVYTATILATRID